MEMPHSMKLVVSFGSEQLNVSVFFYKMYNWSMLPADSS